MNLERTAGRGAVGTNLTEGSIMRGLVIFAIPIVLTNLL